MIIGNILITLSLGAALAACYYYFLAARGQRDVLKYARWSTAGLAILILLAATYLMALILSDQFQVEYVWANSASTLPLLYKFSAFWGGQEGSMLLWLTCGVLFGVALSGWFQRQRDDSFEAPTLFVMSAVQLFPLVMLMLQSPFRTTPDVPFEGNGLSPLLQDPYMAIHPPLLFVGFAGLSVAFAFAIAALWKRDYTGWVYRAWPWTLAAWGFLGLGLAIGGFWAYRVLGWGGYWGWDPVENSSLVPWLLGGALVHGLIAQKTRGRLVRWNLILALSTYVTVIYSTFLTRSGVLANFSVHTFGESPLMPVMLVALIHFAVASLVLFVRRYRDIPAGPDLFKSLLSRDFTSLVVVVAFIFFAVAVSIGTSSPIITGLIAGNGLLCGSSGILLGLGSAGVRLCQQSTVATTYYATTSVPLGIVFAVMMTIAPILAWQESHMRKLLLMLRWPLVFAVFGAFFAAVVMMREPVSLVVVFFALFALGTNTAMIVRIVRANFWKIGGYLAHVGVALALVGIVGTNAYKQVETMTLYQGQSVQSLGYSFQFNGLEQLPNGKYALQVVVRRGEETFLATPKLLPTAQGMVRNPYIHKYATEDLYISPGDYNEGKPAGTILELVKGDSKVAEGYTFKFIDYARSGHDQQGTNVSVGAILEVSKGGVTTVITPTVSADSQKGLIATPITLPGTKIEVALDTPQVGQVVISVLDTAKSSGATPAFVTLEVSREPGINLLWAGLIIIALGTAVAAVRRRLEGQRVLLEAEPAAAAAPVRPVKAKKSLPQPVRAGK